MLRHTVYSGILVACLLVILPDLSHGHGRLWEPPSRSTMWRRGFDTIPNYNDMQLFCGGFQRQVRNGYRCGVCGDPWDGPRENEAGGRYATGQITRTYRQGQTVTIQVDLTANHKGFFEFKLCPTNDPTVKATQDCLDIYPLMMADGSGPRYAITTAMGSNMMDISVRLPSSLKCDQCVLQWRYHTGNSWGVDAATGVGCNGCGPQEEFYGCADVKILPVNGRSTYTSSPSSPTTRPRTSVVTAIPSTTPEHRHGSTATTSSQTPTTRTTAVPTFRTSTRRPTTTTRTTAVPTFRTSTRRPTTTTTQGTNEDANRYTDIPVARLRCRGVSSDTYDNWCQLNCQHRYCPSSYCTCWEIPPVTVRPTSEPIRCSGVGGYAGLGGYDSWCANNCARGFCPESICVCA